MSSPAGARFGTRAVHAGLDPEPPYGDVVPAIHQASTYVQPRPGETAAGVAYSRTSNPTRVALERAIGELEGGLASAFASGTAAAHALVTAACEAGDHVILGADPDGAARRLADEVLARWGLAYDLVDPTDPDAVAAALRPRTRLVWIESPTSPLLDVAEIPAIVDLVGEPLVCVDSTLATPAVQRPLELGAGAVVHSTMQYLGGHSDVVGGVVVVADPELNERLRFVQRSVGAVPGPLDCFLVHRGLRTLELRVGAQTASARAVTELLRASEGVGDVRWPGFGGVVVFRHPEPHRIAAATRIFSPGVALGGVASVIAAPEATASRRADLVLLSCGIEATDDLVADLAQALA